MSNKPSLKALFTAVSLLYTAPIFAVQNAEPMYEINYKEAEITQFIESAGRTLDVSFDIAPSVKGLINVQTHSIRGNNEYFSVFENILNLHGYVIVPNARIANRYSIIPSKDGKKSAAPVSDGELNSKHGMVTQVIYTGNFPASRLSPIVRSLIGPESVGLHSTEPNVIIVRGPRSTVQVITDLINKITSIGHNARDVDIYRLKFVSATEVANIANNILKSASKNSGSQIVAYERLNAVLVSGPDRHNAKKLIEKLDQEAETQGQTRVFSLKYEKAETMAKALEGFAKAKSEEANARGSKRANSAQSAKVNISIQPHEGSNSLVITAPRDIMNEIADVIAKLDERPRQVQVEAIIAEVMDSRGDSLGIQWVAGGGGAVGVSQFGGNSVPVSQFAAAAEQLDGSGFDGLSDTASAALGGVNGLLTGFYTGNWGGLVNALSSDTDSEILSTPSVVTLNNKEASLLVGQTIGVPTSQRTDASNSSGLFSEIKREEVGTKLKVTPQINEDGAVTLKIEQEVSSVVGATTASEYGATFNKRNIINTVLVPDGTAAVLGGLIHEEVTETVNRVPILGYIPLLGDLLFSSKSASKSRRKLMVFIRPTIVNDSNYSQITTQKSSQIYQGIKDAKKKGGGLLRKYSHIDTTDLPPMNPKPLTEHEQSSTTPETPNQDTQKPQAEPQQEQAPDQASVSKEESVAANSTPIEIHTGDSIANTNATTAAITQQAVSESADVATGE